MVHLAPFCLVGLTACSLVSVTDRHVRIEVDPLVRQRIYTIATGEWTESESVLDPDDVACAGSTPRTCTVGEFLRITVVNGGFRPIRYEGNFCPTPIHRLGATDWEWIDPYVTCLAYSRPFEVEPGEAKMDFVFLPRDPERFDWRTADYDLRVELRMWDRDGELPLDLRVSEPFRLTVE
jgi:hypothetical protein